MRGVDLVFHSDADINISKLLAGLPISGSTIVVLDGMVYKNGFDIALPKIVSESELGELSGKDVLVMRMTLQIFPSKKQHNRN